jgi:dTDP-4-amino-4,6-dideoxygalactose transaminase
MTDAEAQLARYNPLPRAVGVPLYPRLPLRPRSAARAPRTGGHPALDVLVAAACGVDPARVTTLSSGTAALRLALRRLRRASTDEVVLPTFCCPNVIQAVLDEDMVPRLCDITEQLTLSAEGVAAAAGPRTRAVVSVRLFGCVNDSGLAALDVPVIDDAAQSLPCEPAPGATSLVLSFGRQKPVPASGSGVLVTLDDGPTPSPEPFPRAHRDGHRFRAAAADVVRRGWSAGPSALGLAPPLRAGVPPAIESGDYHRPIERPSLTQEAAVARALTVRAGWSGAADVHRRYAAATAHSGWVTPHPEAGRTAEHGYYPLLTDRRAEVAALLARQGLETGWLYYPLHRTARYREWAAGATFPVSDRLWPRLVLVPSRPWLSSRQLQRVETALRGLP